MKVVLRRVMPSGDVIYEPCDVEDDATELSASVPSRGFEVIIGPDTAGARIREPARWHYRLTTETKAIGGVQYPVMDGTCIEEARWVRLRNEPMADEEMREDDERTADDGQDTVEDEAGGQDDH